MNEVVPRKPSAFGWNRKLRKADEFSSVFRLRRLWRGHGLDVYRCPNGLEHARLGLVVSKRVLSRAVDRNRAKRVLRECFRLSQRELPGQDLVVRVRVDLPSADYRAEWANFLRAAAASTPAQGQTGRDRPGG